MSHYNAGQSLKVLTDRTPCELGGVSGNCYLLCGRPQYGTE